MYYFPISVKYVIATSESPVQRVVTGYTKRPGRVTRESIFKMTKEKQNPIKLGRFSVLLINL